MKKHFNLNIRYLPREEKDGAVLVTVIAWFLTSLILSAIPANLSIPYGWVVYSALVALAGLVIMLSLAKVKTLNPNALQLLTASKAKVESIKILADEAEKEEAESALKKLESLLSSVDKMNIDDELKQNLIFKRFDNSDSSRLINLIVSQVNIIDRLLLDAETVDAVISDASNSNTIDIGEVQVIS